MRSRGRCGARGRLYRNILLPEWGFTACVIALWAAQGRSWSALRLGAGTPLRLGIGFAIAALFLGLVWAQRRALLARPERLELVRRKIEHADALMPHTVGERRTFAAVAMTAGICEEFLFRGFVMWYFASWFAEGWVGVVLAVVITSVLFGFAHIYLGTQDVLTTGIGGVFFALVVLASGSLWPAMIIHAVVDLNSGDLGFRVANAARTADSAS